MAPPLVKRGAMRRRLRLLRRRREAMLLDLGALVLEMHRHGRFLPDSLQRRAAETVGTDAELRVLSRALDAGDGHPDLVAAGVAGNCEQCGALQTVGAAFCSQCGNQLPAGLLPHKSALGRDPELSGRAPVPRRPVAAAAAARPNGDGTDAGTQQTQVIEADQEEPADEIQDEPEAEVDAEPEAAIHAEPDETSEPREANDAPAPALSPAARRARAARVRQRLEEPSRRTASDLPKGLLAGIGAGILVILLGILVLSGGGDDEPAPQRAEQAPAEDQPEPDRAEETPEPTDAPAVGAALEPVESVTATDYDPSGDGQEHGEEAPLAVDGDAATIWPTEEYETGSLQKDGVGLALMPAEPVAARGLDLRTTTPGFDVTIYGAEDEPPDTADDWTQIASEEAVGRRGRIDLDAAGREFAHYLLWITALPADEGKVEIAEAQLLR